MYSKKTIATATALILILSMIISIVPMQTAQAWTGHKQTYAFIGAVPNPATVGEEVLLHVGISEALQITQDKWHGLTVTVEKPDGTTEELGPYNTDATGGTGDVYVPTMEGTYKLQTHFPAQWYNYSLYDFFAGMQTNNVYYEASDSDILELVVGTEGSTYWPGVPLPGVPAVCRRINV